ncbi:hypothetical protein JXA85_04575 [Candidatus Woesearchaeota archaeon]|nr:hypothetical protein [Candidatus Woesearchaeota archaeon]
MRNKTALLVGVIAVLVISAYLSSGASTINCTIMENRSCSNTKVIYMQNDSGGYNNAHAQNTSVGNYSYALCCNAVGDTLTTSCDDATMLQLNDTTNTHAQASFHSTYTVKACVSANTGKISCSYRNNTCAATETCMVSMASSGADNSTNAHIANCSYYSLQVCCGLNTPPVVSVGPVIKPARPVDADELVCNFTITDVDDSDTLFANYTWYNGTKAIINGSTQVTNGTATTITLGSGNTSAGDRWNCSITPYDQNQYGTEKSINVTINTPPSKVELSYPLNNDSAFINRTPMFNWTTATDANGDSVTYHIQISQYFDFNTTQLFDEISGISSTNFTSAKELDFTTYFWRVQANDSYENGSWSDVWNFTIVKYIAITVVNENVSFPEMAINTEDDTADNNPEPITIQNDGNYEANISINSSLLWQSGLGVLNTTYYQYKANYSAEGSSFDYSKSLTAWQNMQSLPVSFISALNHTDSNDLVAVDIRVAVPADEPPGVKQSTILFTAEEAP